MKVKELIEELSKLSTLLAIISKSIKSTGKVTDAP